MGNGLREYGDYKGPDRRNGNDGWIAAVPVWARAIAVVGIPGAIAIFLVWVGANEIPKIARQTAVNHDAIMRVEDMLREHHAHDIGMYRVFQRICSNTARNEIERQRCFDQ